MNDASAKAAYLSSITNLRDTTDPMALASVALRHSEPQRRSCHSEPHRGSCHSEPKARNLRGSQHRDPSRLLRMTMESHSKPKARNLGTAQRGDPSHSLRMTNQRHRTPAWLRRCAPHSAHCHSEPQRGDCHCEPYRSHCHSEPHRSHCHSEPKARNLGTVQRGDPSRLLGMTMESHSKYKARNLGASQRADPSRSLGMTMESHSEPKAGIPAPCNAGIPRVARDDGTGVPTGDANLRGRGVARLRKSQ
jgi:hypothetical protein